MRRGRTEDNDRKPYDATGKATGGRFKCEFGVPEPKAEENFIDSDNRIMKRVDGGFDPRYNGQTAVDDTAHIIVAAEVSNAPPTWAGWRYRCSGP